MGRYMGKTKRTGHVAGMDLSLGVRTRAKTLALRRLQQQQQQQQQQQSPKLHASHSHSLPPPRPPPPPSSGRPLPDTAASGGYLQLRSRLLKKTPVLLCPSNRRQSRQGAVDALAGNPNPNPNLLLDADSASGGVQDHDSGREATAKIQLEEVQGQNGNNGLENENRDLAVEASFGENCLEGETRERSTRESTPCSFIRDLEIIRTPGSTTQPTCSTDADTTVQNSVPRRIPTAREMDEFFAGAEEEQVKQFIDKYNFDPINEKPLPPGRYEWKKLDP